MYDMMVVGHDFASEPLTQAKRVWYGAAVKANGLLDDLMVQHANPFDLPEYRKLDAMFKYAVDRLYGNR